MRRLSTPAHILALKPEVKEEDASHEGAPAASSITTHGPAATEAKIWDNIPLPSIADPTEHRMMTPKTLLDCCRCAHEFIDEYDLGDGLDIGEFSVMRAVGHLCLVILLRLLCCMTNEAGLASVLSAAFSLKHETDMKKSFHRL